MKHNTHKAGLFNTLYKVCFASNALSCCCKWSSNLISIKS